MNKKKNDQAVSSRWAFVARWSCVGALSLAAIGACDEGGDPRDALEDLDREDEEGCSFDFTVPSVIPLKQKGNKHRFVEVTSKDEEKGSKDLEVHGAPSDIDENVWAIADDGSKGMWLYHMNKDRDKIYTFLKKGKERVFQYDDAINFSFEGKVDEIRFIERDLDKDSFAVTRTAQDVFGDGKGVSHVFYFLDADHGSVWPFYQYAEGFAAFGGLPIPFEDEDRPISVKSWTAVSHDDFEDVVIYSVDEETPNQIDEWVLQAKPVSPPITSGPLSTMSFVKTGTTYEFPNVKRAHSESQFSMTQKANGKLNLYLRQESDLSEDDE